MSVFHVISSEEEYALLTRSIDTTGMTILTKHTRAEALMDEIVQKSEHVWLEDLVVLECNRTGVVQMRYYPEWQRKEAQ